MTKFKELQEGEVLSETQYYTVVKTSGNKVQLETSNGSIVADKDYVENFLSSANQFDNEEKINQTDLINIVLANPRSAMTIYFQKADKAKTKKVYKADLATQATAVGAQFMANGVSAIEEALANPVLSYIPGEMREIKGYFTGSQDERGRFLFCDMELDDRGNKDVVKGVDSRTIQYVVVNNVKSSLKK